MTTVRHPLLPSAWRGFVCALVVALSVLGCGGGVDSGGTGAPVQSFAAGRISGFGSVIVNGVRYDDSNATVVDDEGNARSRSDLKLGMTVEIEAGPVSTDATTQERSSVAKNIQFGSAIRGPVQAVNAAAGTLTVLGQTVKVDADTVLHELPAGIVVLRTGDLLDIHALLDTDTGVYTATRIERAASLPEYRLRGIVGTLDTAAKTFRIGNATISYAGVPAGDLPTLVEGAIARVKLATTPQAGVWQLSRAAVAARPIPNRTEAEIEGFVTGFVSLASFKVNGTQVDASGSDVRFRKGSANQVANGARIEVEGEMRDGVLVAKQVEIKRSGGGEDEAFEVEGRIESVNAAQKSFVVRGVTIVHDNKTRFRDGDAEDLKVGHEVKVKGKLTANGTQVLASRIEFDD